MFSTVHLLVPLLNCLILSATAGASSGGTQAPTAFLDDATFIGSADGLTNKFLGIPYAQPPVGELRFHRPQPIERYTGTHTALDFGPWCPQHYIAPMGTLPVAIDEDVGSRIVNTVFNPFASQSEDCLSLNIWTPPGVNTESALPVAVWIHGGGFHDGGSALIDGGIIVQRAVQLSEPMIVVSINYRLSALGWLTGDEARDAGLGNLGYRDQRLAFQWIQKHIHSFGGDASKVVIWGQSAGAMSVAAHMLGNGGNHDDLFRGAFMHSGSLIPIGDMHGAQVFYDNLVNDAGCSGAFNTLQCLRHIPFDTLKAAIDKSPVFVQSIATSWFPREDDDFFTGPLHELAEKGAIAKVPVVIGACEDEGTMFALASLNITTSEELHAFLSARFFVNATHEEIDELLSGYPEDPREGSPFRTGFTNNLTPQFKRIAALMGDILFETPRKVFLEATAGRQDVWTYVTQRRKDVAGLGSAHVTDLFDMFGPSDLTDHFIHFVNHLDPNGPIAAPPSVNVPESQQALSASGGAAFMWPKYENTSKTKLVYLDGTTPLGLAEDTDRDTQLWHTVKFLKEHPMR